MNTGTTAERSPWGNFTITVRGLNIFRGGGSRNPLPMGMDTPSDILSGASTGVLSC